MNDVKTKFSIFIGLDWANKKHDVCIQIGESSKGSFEAISHKPESTNNCVNELRKKDKIAVAVELTKGPLYMRCRSTVSPLS